MLNLRLQFSLIAFVVMAVSGLGCSPSGSGKAAPAVNVAGSWQGTWNSNQGVSGGLTLQLTDTGGTVSGTMNVTGSPCGNQTTVSGSVSGYTVVISTADSMRFTATVEQNNPSAMSGSYSISAGDCQGDAGTFSLTMPTQPIVPTPTQTQSAAFPASDAG
jgi:hypothetical protein